MTISPMPASRWNFAKIIPSHTNFDRITRSSIGSSSYVHHGRTNRVLEPISKRETGCRLQYLPDNPVYVAAIGCILHSSHSQVMSTVDRAVLKRSSKA